MILLDSCHDSWENEVLFMEIVAIVLDIWLDTFPGAQVVVQTWFLGRA